MSVIWRGNKGLRELPDTSIEETLESSSKVLEYEGPYELCMASRPKPGMFQNDTGYLIHKVAVKRLKAGLGRLTITLDKTLSSAGTDGKPPDSGKCEELDWIETDVDLLKHPRYLARGAKALSDDDIVALRCWEEEPNWKIKKAFKYREDTSKTNSTQHTLTSNAQDFAKKKLRGMDSYRVYYPVAKRTTKISNPLKGSPCGKLLSELPAGLPQPTGYVWSKTADRSLRSGSGKWSRSEEWTGVTFMDPDIYG